MRHGLDESRPKLLVQACLLAVHCRNTKKTSSKVPWHRVTDEYRDQRAPRPYWASRTPLLMQRSSAWESTNIDSNLREAEAGPLGGFPRCADPSGSWHVGLMGESPGLNSCFRSASRPPTPPDSDPQ